MNYRWALFILFMHYNSDTALPVLVVCFSEHSLGTCGLGGSSIVPTSSWFPAWEGSEGSRGWQSGPSGS